ncbi:MAG: hypothetical protein M1442_03695 [Candidatus Thermoplasmatota archaeon]|nr:hypothetical protein [Candidatus Thermoplasmatota archaeon]
MLAILAETAMQLALVLAPAPQAGLNFIFPATAYVQIGAGRKGRTVPVWAGGLMAEPGFYGPYQYSNPVRLMFRYLSGRETGATTPLNREWNAVEAAGRAYRSISYHAGRSIMNSSIGRYMLYILAALIAVLLYVWI